MYPSLHQYFSPLSIRQIRQDSSSGRMFPEPVRSKANKQGQITKGKTTQKPPCQRRRLSLWENHGSRTNKGKEKESQEAAWHRRRASSHDCSEPTVLLSSLLSHVPSAE